MHGNRLVRDSIKKISDLKYVAKADDVLISLKRRQSIDLEEYFRLLPVAAFPGQTSTESHTDISNTNDAMNVGACLSLVDAHLRQFPSAKEFEGTDKEYLTLMKIISVKRKLPGETEIEAFRRIASDSMRFVRIYQKRGVHSQELKNHKIYWGSRQQLLSGKVIADWVDPVGGPLDATFGVLLQPTTGRAGPGDSGWFHHIMFDNSGYISYHSAVHDAFGYLLNFHNIGPGYDYMNCSCFKKSNPLAGQISGMQFWKNVLRRNNDCGSNG